MRLKIIISIMIAKITKSWFNKNVKKARVDSYMKTIHSPQKTVPKQINHTPTHIPEDESHFNQSALTTSLPQNGWQPSQVISMQQVVGNQAVMRLLSKSATGEEELQKTKFTSSLFKSATGEEELQKGAPDSKGDDDTAHANGCGCALCKGSGKVMRHIDDIANVQQNSQHGKAVETSVVEHESDNLTLLNKPSYLMKAATAVSAGAAPSIGLGGDYGLTFPESVDAVITATKVGSTWKPVVTNLTGHYSLQASLLAGQSEITGPGGNTSTTNWKKQVKNLAKIGEDVGNPWYMLQAVVDHENVHASRFKPALDKAEPTITAALEAVTVPDAPGKDEAQAIVDLKASAGYKSELTKAQATWLTEILTLVAGDHNAGGPTEIAERKIVDPMRTQICAHAKKEGWGTSPDCP
jgi:hypothetical protein